MGRLHFIIFKYIKYFNKIDTRLIINHLQLIAIITLLNLKSTTIRDLGMKITDELGVLIIEA